MNNMGFKNSRRYFVVLFGAFLLLFANMGLSLSGIPLFYRPVPEALGFTQTAFNATQTVSGLVGMVITPFAGVFIQKHFRKNQLLMLIAAVLTFLAFLAMSCATRLWEFYIACGVRGVTGVFIGGIAITMMVNNWFLEKRAMAISAAYVGTSLGGIFYTKLLAWAITEHGWQAGYLWAGIICAVLSLIAIALCTPEPGMVGAVPYGFSDIEKKPEEEKRALWGMKYKTALRSPIFWLFCFGILLGGMVAMTTQQLAVTSLQTDGGLTTEQAASVFSVYLLILCFAKLLLGLLFDKFGNKVGNLYIGVLITITTLMLASLSKFPALAYPMAVVFGLSNMLGTIGTPMMTSGLFGVREYASIYALITFCSSIGSSVGPLFMGGVFDRTGNYSLGWFVFAAASAVSTAILSFCISRRKFFEKKYPEG